MFTLTQVLWLVVLYMTFAGLASGWIMFMVGVKVADKDADRRIEDLHEQYSGYNGVTAPATDWNQHVEDC